MFKTYNFQTPQQWRSGLSYQLALDNSGISTPVQQQFTQLIGSTDIDVNALLAADPIGDVYWLRPTTLQLVRALPDSHCVVLELDLNRYTEPQDLVLGFSNLWLRVKSASRPPYVLRFHRETGAPLTGIEIGRPVLAICNDGHDGIWLVLGGKGFPAVLHHYNGKGLLEQCITLEHEMFSADLAIDQHCRQLLVLDNDPQVDLHGNPVSELCESPIAWRLWQVAICSPSVQIIYTHMAKDGVCYQDVSPFLPDLLAIDHSNRPLLLQAQTGELWSLSMLHSDEKNTSSIVSQTRLAIPTSYLPIKDLLGGADKQQGIVVSTERGLAQVLPQHVAAATDIDEPPTYITPVLVSPQGAQKGWLRADINAVLDSGAAIKISVAASDDYELIQQARELAADSRLSKTDRLRRIDKLLPWQTSLTSVYHGRDWPHNAALRFALHEIECTHIWLRLQLFADARERVCTVNKMTVVYPNLSYTRFLPAIYQRDELGAKTLRRFLVGFESVFGDLNQRISELPCNIDPRTAPDEWLVLLLRWLGLPAATELSIAKQRQLLIHAATLLKLRGTLQGLQALLDVIVGRNAYSLRDSGVYASSWILPVRSRAALGPRLGKDTQITALRPRGFCLSHSACLGRQTLGASVQRRTEVFTLRGRAIDIRITPDTPTAENLHELLSRYLPYFIPAQCRYRLHFVTQRNLRRPPVLDNYLVLSNAYRPRLGDGAILGRMALPAVSSSGRGIVVGRSHLGTGLHL